MFLPEAYIFCILGFSRSSIFCILGPLSPHFVAGVLALMLEDDVYQVGQLVLHRGHQHRLGDLQHQGQSQRRVN